MSRLIVLLFVSVALSANVNARLTKKWEISCTLGSASPPENPQPNCPIVHGCVTGGVAMCNAGPAGDMCDISYPEAVTECHWPTSHTGCTQIGTTPDCICEPAPALAMCPTVHGCVAGGMAMCNAGPAGDMCDMSNPADNMPCHWPAAGWGTCTPLAGTPDCLCAPADGHWWGK